MEHTFFIGTFIRMRAEVVTLCLDQVSWQHRRTVAVVVRHCSGEGRHRNTVLHSVSHNVTQRLLILISDIFEVRCQQQVGDTFVFSIGVGDFLQELRTNDATRAEDLRDFTVVQIPVVFVRCSTQLREALRVGDDFTQIQCATDFLNELCFITSQFSLRPERTLDAATRWSFREEM